LFRYFYSHVALFYEKPELFQKNFNENLNSLLERYESNNIQIFDDVCIAALTKLNFDKMDKEFQRFGKEWFDSFPNRKENFSKDEYDFIMDAFCSLVLNNVGFSNEVLFPNVNILGIQNKSQIEMLMNEMYFQLHPTVKLFQDFNFYFK
jgi:hypothetical protein